MSRRYDGAVRSEYSIERRRAYHRARTRARHAVAMLHCAEYLQVVTPLRAGHRSDSREYEAAEASAKREIARRYPDDFARLLDEQLVSERMGHR